MKNIELNRRVIAPVNPYLTATIPAPLKLVFVHDHVIAGLIDL